MMPDPGEEGGRGKGGATWHLPGPSSTRGSVTLPTAQALGFHYVNLLQKWRWKYTGLSSRIQVSQVESNWIRGQTSPSFPLCFRREAMNLCRVCVRTGAPAPSGVSWGWRWEAELWGGQQWVEWWDSGGSCISTHPTLSICPIGPWSSICPSGSSMTSSTLTRAPSPTCMCLFLADTMDFIIIVFGFWAFGVGGGPRPPHPRDERCCPSQALGTWASVASAHGL